MEDKILKCSMDIILHAGDARTLCYEAMDKMLESNFDEAESLIKEAQEKILVSHRIHTEFLQKCLENDDNTYSILFAHAQDTLMTISTEINMASKMLIAYKKLDERVKALES